MRSARAAFDRWGKDLTVESVNKKGKLMQEALAIPPLEGGGRFMIKASEDRLSLDGIDTPKGTPLPKTLDIIVSAKDSTGSIPGCNAEAVH